MVHVQTGHGLDVVIDGESIGLLKRGDNQILWLDDPESLLEILAAEVKRLNPAEPSKCKKCNHDHGLVEDVHYCNQTGCKCKCRFQ